MGKVTPKIKIHSLRLDFLDPGALWGRQISKTRRFTIEARSLTTPMGSRSGEIHHLRELIKLPHVRQIQESSLGLSRGCPVQGRLGPGSDFLIVYTCFRDFEALRVDSQSHISLPY